MSDIGQKQVFQSESPRNWNRIQWTGRILMFFLVILLFIAIFTISREIQPSLPQIKDKNEQYKKILNPSVPITMKTDRNAKFQGFADYFIETRKQNAKYLKLSAKLNLKQKIRAGFYVDWDPQSFYSLRANISKMNMVIPFWFYLDPKGDSIRTTVDKKVLVLIKRNHVPIVPMLTNINTDPKVNTFDGNLLHSVLINPVKRRKIIKDLVAKLEAYQFQGVNIDFEELKESTDENLISFQKEIYLALHSKNLLVSQDVIPQNSDYNYEQLSKYNDYIFLMAYDQNNDQSQAGPICEQKWVQKIYLDLAKKIPAKKIVLAIAGYGYDWPKQSVANTVTYQQALNLVKENDEAKIFFDPNTYNLSFHYIDDNDVDHNVYFTDAITNFNSIRFADESGMAGVALWRLGAEDSRLWTFFKRNISLDSLKKNPFDFKLLKNVGLATAVDYVGEEGEILDVLRTPSEGKINLKIDSTNMLISQQDYIQLPSGYVVKRTGFKPKSIVLTFDDGPDPIYTPAILDILEKEKVPATFFVVGINAENNIPIIKRIYDDGFEIGNHTFTHPNIAQVSEKRAKVEMSTTRLLIESITGHSTIMFRPPFNADAEPETRQEILPVALSKSENYYTIGEKIDPEDWEVGIKAATILSRVEEAEDTSKNIVLLHDAGGDTRMETVKALPGIIHFFKSKGYTFTTVADLLNKTRDEVMPRIPNGSYFLVKTNYLLASIGYYGSHIIFSLFLVAIILGLGKIVFLGVMALYQRGQNKRERFSKIPYTPRVDIIVPAYNEEVNAVKTVNNLLQADYPNFRILFVDDGSKDQTYELVSQQFHGNEKVLVLTKPNGGKASALNYGISQSDANFVVCIDADTQLKKDAISLMMRYFTNPEVGAVAGNVKVGNETTILTIWQSIEYITSQNFDRMAFDSMNCISVVPGAIGAFRKESIIKAGGFTSDTLAEDCDLTIRILRLGYSVRNCSAAIAVTEAPETMKMFLKQRFRWSFGIIQSFWKNRDACFNPRFNALGLVALPNILIFQIFIPLIAPLADLFMILGIIWGNGVQILTYYLAFMLVDAVVASMAFIFEKEDLRKILWLIPQRLVYRQLMYYILFKSLKKALKGEIQHWGTLKRTGNVEEVIA